MEEIEVRNVSKDFLDASGKPFHAIRDISFTWVKGENIILDELTSGLDLISQKAIREVLEAYHREYRCSYFLITHDMKFAYRLSQRIYELESGQIVNIGQSNIDINSQERK